MNTIITIIAVILLITIILAVRLATQHLRFKALDFKVQGPCLRHGRPIVDALRHPRALLWLA